MRILSGVFLLHLSVIAYAGGAAELVITPETIFDQITNIGAKRVVAEYYDKKEWPIIINGIASGDDRWLGVYSALEPFSDAGAGEDLDLAIFRALPKVPFMVIPLFLQEYTVQQVCTFTFEASAPDEGIGAYLERLEMSLSKASTEQEKQIAFECRRGIAQTRVAFKEHPLY